MAPTIRPKRHHLHPGVPMIEQLATLFFERGDIGHVALFLWAASTSGLALAQLRQLSRTTRSFESFVMAIARLNAFLVTENPPATPPKRT
jgi:hypothetical protein